MEQFSVNGLPVTLLSTDAVKLYPTADGSFFLLRATTTGYPSSGGLYHIKRTGDSFDYLSTIASVSGVTGTTYPRSIFQYTESASGYVEGKAVVVIRKTTYTSASTSNVELFTLSLDGGGSLLKTFSMAHNFAVNSWPSSNFDFIVNSARSSVMWLVGSTLYEGVIDSTTVASTALGTVIFQTGSAPMYYIGEGAVAVRASSGTGVIHRYPTSATAPSTFGTTTSLAGATGNNPTNMGYNLELGSTIYKASKSGTTYSFSLGYTSPSATLFTRSYTEPNATFDLSEGQPFQFRQEGVYSGAWLFMRHINGAYLMTLETFENFPDYSSANIAAFPGNIDPDRFGLTIFGSDAYCYTLDVSSSAPIVLRVPIGDYSQLVSQNEIFISPIIGESVNQVTTELLDYGSRSTTKNELRFLSVKSSGISGQLQPLSETAIRFTDDTLQRKQSSKVSSYGDFIFTTETQKTGNLSLKLTPQIPYLGVRNSVSSINPDMREESFLISLAGGSGFLANRTLTLTVPGDSSPTATVIPNVYPVTHAFTCPYTGNLYLIYTATSSLLMTYIDVTTKQIINTFNVAGYPILVRVSAENEVTFVYGTANATTPTNKRTINTLTGTLGTVTAYVASDITNYTYPLSTSTGQPRTLNFANGDAAIQRGIATTLLQDNFAYSTRGKHVMDNLRQKRAFNQDWYYVRTMVLKRISTGVSTEKTSEFHALMQVTLHNGNPPTRWSLQQFNNDTAFLYESWPDLLKVTPFTLYIPEDLDFVGVPVPVEPDTTIKLRLYGWLRGG